MYNCSLIAFLCIICIGLQVTQEALDDVATISGVMSVGDDYLPRNVNRLFPILME